MRKLEKISKIKPHPENPRIIKDQKFKKLVKSLKDFPEMMEKRPIVVNKNMICLGGNMRLKAAKEAGLKEIWIDVADWPEEKQNEFIIKDNANFGEWDFDVLANEWDSELLDDWAVDVFHFKDEMSNQKLYGGLDAEQELDDFLNAEIKRFCLAYESGTFEKVVDWLNKKIDDLGLKNYSEFILKLMEQDEKN